MCERCEVLFLRLHRDAMAEDAMVRGVVEKVEK